MMNYSMKIAAMSLACAGTGAVALQVHAVPVEQPVEQRSCWKRYLCPIRFGGSQVAPTGGSPKVHSKHQNKQRWWARLWHTFLQSINCGKTPPFKDTHETHDKTTAELDAKLGKTVQVAPATAAHANETTAPVAKLDENQVQVAAAAAAAANANNKTTAPVAQLDENQVPVAPAAAANANNTTTAPVAKLDEPEVQVDPAAGATATTDPVAQSEQNQVPVAIEVPVAPAVEEPVRQRKSKLPKKQKGQQKKLTPELAELQKVLDDDNYSKKQTAENKKRRQQQKSHRRSKGVGHK